MAFSADGNRLFCGSADKTIKVWDVQTGQELLTLKGHTAMVKSVALSPDGKRLVSGSDPGIRSSVVGLIPCELQSRHGTLTVSVKLRTT